MQAINLYLHIPKAYRNRITLKQMLQIIGLTALLLGIIGGLKQGSNQWLKWQYQTMMAKEQAEQQHMVAMKKQYPKIIKSAELQTKHDQLQATLQLYWVLLKDLQSPRLSNNQGFLTIMEALATHIVPYVWLREINIQAGGQDITINGSTRQVAAVRTFIKYLAADPVFKNYEFKLKRLETSVVDATYDDFSIIISPALKHTAQVSVEEIWA